MTINLYTQEGCPKCNILRQACHNSKSIMSADFKEIKINPADKNDTDVQLLLEHKIQSVPVLLVDNDFYTFRDAMEFIEGLEED